MKTLNKYVGLNVHKDTTVIAVAEGDRSGAVRLYGQISSDLHALEKALHKIGSKDLPPTWPTNRGQRGMSSTRGILVDIAVAWSMLWESTCYYSFAAFKPFARTNRDRQSGKCIRGAAAGRAFYE